MEACSTIPGHPQLIVQLNAILGHLDHLSVAGCGLLRANAAAARSIVADYSRASKIAPSPVPAPVTLLLGPGHAAFFTEHELAKIQAHQHLSPTSTPAVFATYAGAFFTALYNALQPPSDAFPVFSGTHLPFIEKQHSSSCWMHATHALLCRSFGGRRAAPLYDLICRSKSMEIRLKPLPASSSASSIYPLALLPEFLRPNFPGLLSSHIGRSPCDTGMNIGELQHFFALLNRGDDVHSFLGHYNVRCVFERSHNAPPGGKHTFSNILSVVSRYVDRVLRYGFIAPATSVSLDDETDIDELYRVRDKEHFMEPVLLPINQLLFMYGTEGSMGHDISFQRVDPADASIPFPVGKDKSRYWWAQDSLGSKGLQLYHEDDVPMSNALSWTIGGQELSVLALRLPTSVQARQATTAAAMNAGINEVLTTAGLESLGGIQHG